MCNLFVCFADGEVPSVESQMEAASLQRRIGDLADQVTTLLRKVHDRNSIILQTLFVEGDDGQGENPEIPELPPDEKSEVTNGYLEYGEMASLNFNARYVTQTLFYSMEYLFRSFSKTTRFHYTPDFL